MRSPKFVLAVIAVLAPATASAEPWVWVHNGNAAATDFHQVSTDGCVHTSGQFGVVDSWTIGDPVYSGLVATGIVEDVCAGTSYPFFGTGDGEFLVLGTFFAHVRGSVFAGNDRGDPPLTLEIDLSWLGHGPVERGSEFIEDEDHVSLSCMRRRSAFTYGELTIDGAAASVSAGMLVGESNGVIRY